MGEIAVRRDCALGCGASAKFGAHEIAQKFFPLFRLPQRRAQ
jgi:hypothetical protein